MRSRSTLDTMFISADTPRWPLHGGAVLVLGPTTSPNPVTFEAIKEQLHSAGPRTRI